MDFSIVQLLVNIQLVLSSLQHNFLFMYAVDRSVLKENPFQLI